MPYHLTPPPQGPLTRIIGGIVAIFVLVGTFMIGMIAFLVIAGLVLLAGIVIWLRVAWIKRRLKKTGVNPHNEAEDEHRSGHVIDAEYTVVEDQVEKRDKNQR